MPWLTSPFQRGRLTQSAENKQKTTNQPTKHVTSSARRGRRSWGFIKHGCETPGEQRHHQTRHHGIARLDCSGLFPSYISYSFYVSFPKSATEAGRAGSPIIKALGKQSKIRSTILPLATSPANSRDNRSLVEFLPHGRSPRTTTTGTEMQSCVPTEPGRRGLGGAGTSEQMAGSPQAPRLPGVSQSCLHQSFGGSRGPVPLRSAPDLSWVGRQDFSCFTGCPPRGERVSCPQEAGPCPCSWVCERSGLAGNLCEVRRQVWG